MNYFSQVTLSPGSYESNQLLKRIAQNAYVEHQQLWQLFPEAPDKTRDFIFHSEQRQMSRVYHLVSKRKPLENLIPWEVQTKSYDPKIATGQRLTFKLNVNPVVSRKDKAGRSHRHDVVMDAKQQLKAEGIPQHERPASGEIIQKAGINWLNQRSEKNGFSFQKQEVIVDGYERRKAYKGPGKSPIEYSVLGFSGILTVIDPVLFKEILINGIGPAKAFGCGLMLIRRV